MIQGSMVNAACGRWSPPAFVLMTACAFMGCERSGSDTVSVELPDTVTYASHVAPILFESCAGCHRPGGHAPFALLRYEDARTQGPAIVSATSERRMPPWLPDSRDVAFEGDRRLPVRQIALLRKWVETGAQFGDSTTLPEAPTFPDGWQLGPPDMVLPMPDPYVLPAGGSDRFRNFVIPASLKRSRYVRAVDLDPGEGHVVHHAVINIDPTRSSRRMDNQDPEPGFDGMFSATAARPPEGAFLGWTPGKVPHGGTEGLAWQLEPGTDIVLQLHLQPRGSRQTVQASVGLYFTDDPPTRLSYWLTLGSREIDLPAGQRGIEVTDRYVLPVDAEVFGIYPHAHYLGDVIEGNAELPDGEVVSLIDIPRWNFNHQDSYRYGRPVSLPRGTALTMRITFDNSPGNPLNPNTPPRNVSYGPASGDEMANLFIHLVLRDSSDLNVLAQDFGRKYQRDLERGMRFLLEVFPENTSYMAELGQLLQSRGALDEAKAWYRQALDVDPGYQLARYNLATAVEAEGDLASAKHLYALVTKAEPDNVPAIYNLASVLHAEGDVNEAILNYLRVIELEPTHADAHNNLGNGLMELRRPQDAFPYYVRTLQLDPNHADAHNNLGNFYSGAGQLDSAVVHFRRAVEIRPRHSLAHFNLGRLLVELGDAVEGVEAMRTSVRLEPDWYIGWATLAWTLATHADETIRNSTQALEYARRAAALSDNVHPVVLDALAAAYAAGGQYDRAIETAERAVEVATSVGDLDLVNRIQGRLTIYRRGEPYIVR